LAARGDEFLAGYGARKPFPVRCLVLWCVVASLITGTI
jgi:hypothetical protein